MIDPHVSDLFFNLDKSNAELRDSSGNFEGYDRDKLLTEAEFLVDCLYHVNMKALDISNESLDRIVDNFLNRV